MAKYDREFLVPYLQAVCALHFAQLEIGCNMLEIQMEIQKLRRGEEVKKPERPVYETEWDLLSVIFAGAGMFLMVGPIVALLGGLLMNDFNGGQLGLVIVETIIGLPVGWILWHMASGPVKEAKKRNAELLEQYHNEEIIFPKLKKLVEESNEEGRKKIPELEKQLDFYSSELKKITHLLEEAYSTAVLPMQYRDVYAATYLYDYFSNSRADDLDQVLNTYVLEQIKDKLDIIIENQRVSILQQRMILVNQHRSMEEQRIHNAYMRNKINQIAANLEEEKQYLGMIECNTSTTAFFAAANYLR